MRSCWHLLEQVSAVCRQSWLKRLLRSKGHLGKQSSTSADQGYLLGAHWCRLQKGWGIPVFYFLFSPSKLFSGELSDRVHDNFWC